MTEKERKELLRELSFIKNRVEEIYSKLKKDGDFSVTMIEQQEKREKKITKLLRALGAPVSNKGYRYIKESLLLCLNDPTILNNGITYRLYPSVAETFNTTPTKVERNIRHEILTIFRDKRKGALLVELFPCYSDTGKATNLEFLTTLVDYLRE